MITNMIASALAAGIFGFILATQFAAPSWAAFGLGMLAYWQFRCIDYVKGKP